MFFDFDSNQISYPDASKLGGKLYLLDFLLKNKFSQYFIYSSSKEALILSHLLFNTKNLKIKKYCCLWPGLFPIYLLFSVISELF